MTIEPVTIALAGAPLLGWTRVELRASVKEAARQVTLHLVDTPGSPTLPGRLKGGPMLTVSASGELLFTGYVDRVRPNLSGKNFAIEVTARGKGQDAVDCSVDHTKPDYVGQTALAAAQDQDIFGIGFSADIALETFDRWRPNVGDTLFNALRPLCEDNGATMSGQPDGSIRITRAGETAKAQGGAIAEGVNIWTIEGDFDLSGQHSQVNAHGQSYKGHGAEAVAIHALADNADVARLRPVHEHHDRQTDRGRIVKRASRRRDKEQGEGTRATVGLRGWRDSGGMLWTPGNKVFVTSPSLSLNQYMLIESADYAQDGKAGTSCTLHLCDPRAHGGKGGGVNKSGGGWGFSNPAAT